MSPESPPRQRLRSSEDRERDTFIWAFTRGKCRHRLGSATRVGKNSVVTVADQPETIETG